MNKDQQVQFEEAIRKVDEMYTFFESLRGKNIDELIEFMEALKNGTIPLNDNQRVLSGIGFFGRETGTTPAGTILVNSPEGPIKLLTA